MYDATLGRFLSRDPIGVWNDPLNEGNGYAYVGDSPADWTDAFGLGQEVVVGAITGKNSKDAGDTNIEKASKDRAELNKFTGDKSQTEICLSYSVSDFVNCVKRAYDACMAKAKAKKTPEANAQKECCVSKLVRVGHASAGLGGREGTLTAAQRKQLVAMLCAKPTIVNAGCYSFVYSAIGRPGYAGHVTLAMLASEAGGGTYQGFPGGLSTTGIYPDVEPADPVDPKQQNTLRKIEITGGMSEKDIKAQMDKIGKVESKP